MLVCIIYLHAELGLININCWYVHNEQDRKDSCEKNMDAHPPPMKSRGVDKSWVHTSDESEECDLRSLACGHGRSQYGAARGI